MKKARIMLSAILVLSAIGGAFAYKTAKSADVLWCKFSTGVACRSYSNATTSNTGTQINCPSAAVTTKYYQNSGCTGTPVTAFSTTN